MLVGPPVALCVMANCPAMVPTAVGVHAMAIWQVPDGATLVPQLAGLPVDGATRAKLVPVMAMPVRLSVANPELVTTMLCDAPVVLITVLPRFNVEAETRMPGTATAAPVPVTLMTWGFPVALLTIVTLPANAPTVNGVKVMSMLHGAAAGRWAACRLGMWWCSQSRPRW